MLLCIQCINQGTWQRVKKVTHGAGRSLKPERLYVCGGGKDFSVLLAPNRALGTFLTGMQFFAHIKFIS